MPSNENNNNKTSDGAMVVREILRGVFEAA